MAYKIYLSPSDQWANRTASGHSEAHHCTQIAKSCQRYLVNSGYNVLIGDNSTQGTYGKRVEQSNSWGADVHVCIHTNAGGGVGTYMLAYPSSVNNKYVKNVYQEVANLTPTKDRGIAGNSRLTEIVKTKAVCVYLEAEFHDNATTEKWIDSNIDAIGKAIASGICKADGKSLTNSSSQVPSKNVKYIVQAGAFSSKENAENLVNKLKAAGFDSVIKNV